MPDGLDPIVVTTLRDSLQAVINTAQVLSSEVKQSAISLAELRVAVKILEQDVKGLSTILKDSTTDNVVVKLAVLDTEMKNIIAWKSSSTEYLNSAKEEDEKMRNQMRLAILTGVLSLVGSVVASVVGFAMHHWL